MADTTVQNGEVSSHYLSEPNPYPRAKGLLLSCPGRRFERSIQSNFKSSANLSQIIGGDIEAKKPRKTISDRRC